MTFLIPWHPPPPEHCSVVIYNICYFFVWLELMKAREIKANQTHINNGHIIKYRTNNLKLFSSCGVGRAWSQARVMGLSWNDRKQSTWRSLRNHGQQPRGNEQHVSIILALNRPARDKLDLEHLGWAKRGLDTAVSWTWQQAKIKIKEILIDKYALRSNLRSKHYKCVGERHTEILIFNISFYLMTFK